MQGKCNLDLSFCLADNGFSLDELVFRLGELFEKKAFNELLRLILMLVQEVLISRIFTGKKVPFECCDKQDFKLNGSYKRRIRTSLGEVNLKFQRVACKSCGVDIVILKDFLNIKQYQTKSNELEEIVVNAISETSYRRAVKSIGDHKLIKLSHHTAHNWVMQTDCAEINLSKEVIGSIGPTQVVADGTGFKGRAVNGKARKGDLKVVVGVNTAGEVFPLGSWTDTTWKEVNTRWKEQEIKFPEGSILVADGEPGLADAFSEQVELEQRCHWHVVRDLYHCMHHDGAPLSKTKYLQKGLAGVLAIELPEEDFKKVTESEKDEIEKKMDEADDVLGRLIVYLGNQGYDRAATYIAGARKSMFGYVRRWLKFGIICPRASSLIERVIRELGRRLKKLAYNWSDKGAAKIARIILKKFTNEKEWEAYWKERLKIVGNVVLNVENYTITAQDLRH
jgi:hypothetical protein